MTKQFNRIAFIDFGYSTEFLEALQQLSQEPLARLDTDKSAACDDADVLVCSWKDKFGRNEIANFPSLRYIATRATSLDNFDLSCLAERGIPVGNITGYGDQATAEFVIQHLLTLSRNRHRQLHGKMVGFIGFGKVAKLIAPVLQALGVCCAYYTPAEEVTRRTRAGVQFTDKPAVLKADFITVHSPPGAVSLSHGDLNAIPSTTDMIVTTLGLPFAPSIFRDWAINAASVVVMDRVAAGQHDFSDIPKVRVIDVYAARCLESRQEAERQVLQNIKGFLAAEGPV